MNLKEIEEKAKVKVEYYEKIESTHLYAKKIAGKKEDKILIAEEQTGGIGTKGRNWYTGQGKNIAMTIILHPDCKINKLEGLTVEIASKIKGAIYELYGYNLEIKEPNDLILNNKKICGILTEINTIRRKNKLFVNKFWI